MFKRFVLSLSLVACCTSQSHAIDNSPFDSVLQHIVAQHISKESRDDLLEIVRLNPSDPQILLNTPVDVTNLAETLERVSSLKLPDQARNKVNQMRRAIENRRLTGISTILFADLLRTLGN